MSGETSVPFIQTDVALNPVTLVVHYLIKMVKWSG